MLLKSLLRRVVDHPALTADEKRNCQLALMLVIHAMTESHLGRSDAWPWRAKDHALLYRHYARVTAPLRAAHPHVDFDAALTAMHIASA